MNPLTLGWNEFKELPYVLQVFSAPSGAIFGGVDNEMMYSMTSHIYLYVLLVF